MMDDQGRIWMTSKIRNNTAPAWCSDATNNKYAAYWGAKNGSRQASYYDPKTQKFQLIETSYSTHHLQFDNDPDATVYFNELSGPTFGWVDSKVYDRSSRTPRMKPRPNRLQWAGATRFSILTGMAKSPSPGTTLRV